jgi:GT2 family glycosyltransferase
VQRVEQMQPNRTSAMPLRDDVSSAPLRASVIVCTHNGGERIEPTLVSLLRQDFPDEAYEILVVDNASSDATPQVVGEIARRRPGRIRVVREPALGHSRARNRGVLNSRGHVLAFTDDDARVSPGWLGALVDTCEQPEVGGAGGPVRSGPGEPLPAWIAPQFRPYLALFDKGMAKIDLSYNEYPRGVNMAYPRQSFGEVGLFSTAFGLKGRSLLYYDEIEFCYRLERSGRRILYVPDAEVTHAIHPGRLTIAWFKQRFYAQGRSEAYFDLVHRGGPFVLRRLTEHGRLAGAGRDRPAGSAGAIDLQRHCRVWSALGYGVGAAQGWLTGVRHRARPAPFERARGTAGYSPS